MEIPAVKIFVDTSSVSEIEAYSEKAWVSGFTTNPTLMRKGGVSNYREFARAALGAAKSKPLSLEVIADDVASMTKQGLIMGTWGDNVVVKIPITNTLGESCAPTVRSLLDSGITVNVTAVMTEMQVEEILRLTNPGDSVIVSVFAGRIADSGVDPVPLMSKFSSMSSLIPGVQILWASPREVLNVVQAAQCGCDIITVTPDLLQKLPLLGKDLEDFSLETVRMFYEDALSAGLEIL